MLAAARQFTEDDLTRDLKLALDLFRDLQSSLQPRLHLEMGLLRLIHAGRLQPIEEAMAALGGSGKTRAPPVSSESSAPSETCTGGIGGGPVASATEGDFRTRLLATLHEGSYTRGGCGGPLGSRGDSSRDYVYGSQDVSDVPEGSGI